VRDGIDHRAANRGLRLVRLRGLGGGWGNRYPRTRKQPKDCDREV
jgi:hypothetical protein